MKKMNLLKSLFVTVFVFAANLTVFAGNPPESGNYTGRSGRGICGDFSGNDPWRERKS